jgi:hypothetical protein
MCSYCPIAFSILLLQVTKNGPNRSKQCEVTPSLVDRKGTAHYAAYPPPMQSTTPEHKARLLLTV